MSLGAIEKEIAGLSHDEKVQLIRRLAGELGLQQAGIEKTPDVVGGDACIAGTRIPIWMLENYRRLGVSEAQLLENYPTLHAADLVNAWAYVDANSEEIERAIQANEMV